MGQKDKDTNLSSNNQNPSNENDEIAPNMELEQPRAGEDSDSEVENEDQWGGYLPLAQNPNDETNNDSEDEENMVSTTTSDNNEAASNNPENIKEAATALVEEVWSKPAPKEVEIEMTQSKINLVKEAMGGFSLPPESIPNWAKNIPEDQWNEFLMKKINKE